MPDTSSSWRLVLVRRGRVFQEPFLRAGRGGEHEIGRFYLSERGDYSFLFARDRFLVFAGAAYVATVPVEASSAAVVRGQLLYCPDPKIDSVLPQIQSSFLGLTSQQKDKDFAALLVRAEVDGSRDEVLLGVDEKRLDREFPNPSEWAMTLAPRADGKLWLVGLSSGEVLLASQGGRILRRRVLPFRFPTDEDDPINFANPKAFGHAQRRQLLLGLFHPWDPDQLLTA